MSAEDWAYLAARSDSEWANGGFRTVHRPSLNATGRTAQDVYSMTIQAAASAAAAASSYTLMAALGAAAYSIGTPSLSLPRAGDLGSGAFGDGQYAGAPIVNQQNTAYQITLHDFGKLLLSTSGANTYTLPVGTDLPEGWWCLWHNISGSNLVIQRSGTDTINAAATSVTIATGSTIGTIVRRSSSTFLIG